MSEELIAPHLKPLDGPPPADIVVGSDTSLLDGYTIKYKYTTGREYKLDFTAAGVTFTMLDAPVFKPEFGVPVTLPYLAREIRDGQILIHWMVPGRSGHVSPNIDFTEKQIFVAALMPFKMEFFDSATIYSATRHGKTVI